MPAAIILLDNTIAGVLMADADVDSLPEGWPEGAKLINAPEGCHPGWKYDPATGFEEPPTTCVISNVLSTRVEF